MLSPKSYSIPRKREPRPDRVHTNKKFYNSVAWREVRKSYILGYEKKLFDEIPRGYWTSLGVWLNFVLAFVALALAVHFVTSVG
jgi:hypothetical protein